MIEIRDTAFSTGDRAAVARYYFNLDNSEHDPDREGTDLSSEREAFAQALAFAGQVLGESEPGIKGHGDRIRLNVVRDDGKRVMTIAIDIDRDGRD